MPLNHYVTLGRSGLRVSPFCLGTMTFGQEWSIGVGADESARVLDAYLERGGNFVDTANIYNKGHSEKILGDHLSANGKRGRVVLATKFCGGMDTTDPNSGGAGRKAIMAACEQSLRRLKTDYIDLYWMHFLDAHTPIDETMRTLDMLVKQGKVRYLGFSDVPAWKVVQAQYEAIFRSWTPLAALQIEYSLLERSVEADLIPMAREMGLGVTPWSPLKYGILSGKYTRDSRPKDGRGASEWVTRHLTDHAFRVIETLHETAKEQGCTPAQAALAWLSRRPGVTSTIIGAKTLTQLEENLKGLEVTLSPASIARLDEVTKPTLPFPHDFLQMIPTVIHGGQTINSVCAPPWGNAPKGDNDRH